MVVTESSTRHMICVRERGTTRGSSAADPAAKTAVIQFSRRDAESDEKALERAVNSPRLSREAEAVSEAKG